MISTKDNNTMIEDYKKSLTEKELKAYKIAESHMGTLFQVEKTAGFLEWKKKQNL